MSTRKERQNKAKRESNKRRRNRNREWVYQYLINNPCVDCGETDPVVLEFDHVGETKKKSVSRAMLHYGLDYLIEEVAQCEVRCANCHRRVTAIENDWWVACRSYGLEKPVDEGN